MTNYLGLDNGAGAAVANIDKWLNEASTPAQRNKMVLEFFEEYKKLTPEKQAALAKEIKDKIVSQPELLTLDHVTHPGKKRNATVFVLQALLYSIENTTGSTDATVTKTDTFPEYSIYHDNLTGLGDGIMGWRTFSAFANKTYDKATGKFVDDATPNAFTALAAGAESKPVQVSGQAAAASNGMADKQPTKTQTEIDAENAAKARQADANKSQTPDADQNDLNQYTFVREPVKYVHAITNGLNVKPDGKGGFVTTTANDNTKDMPDAFNPYVNEAVRPRKAAAGLTEKQIAGINDAVHEYCFKDGKLNDQIDLNNEFVIKDIRAKVREKTKELGLTAEQINSLTFSAGTTKTRSIVGSFKAAEQIAVNADVALSKEADVITVHFNQPDNAKYLSDNGIKTTDIVELKNWDESQRGVYFKTTFVPTLTKLQQHEEKVLRDQADADIAAEKAKLEKFNTMRDIVTLGFPPLVDKQKIGPDGKPMFTEEKYGKYNEETGKAENTIVQKPVMYKDLDLDNLKPITEVSTLAQKEALVASGLMTKDKDSNYTYNKLTDTYYTIQKDGKNVRVEVSEEDLKEDQKKEHPHYTQHTTQISADKALQDPKTYHNAIKDALGGKDVYGLTDAEKLKTGPYGGAQLGADIANKKIDKLSETATAEVNKAILAINEKLKVDIATSPSQLMLKDADKSLNDYKSAIGFYNRAAAYETQRKIAEVSDGTADHSERKDLKVLGEQVRTEHEKRYNKSKAELAKLKDAEGKETDAGKKAAIHAKIAKDEADVKALDLDASKKFDRRDHVSFVAVKLGDATLLNVEDVTKKELKDQKNAAKLEAKAAADQAKLEKEQNDAAEKQKEDKKQKKVEPQVVSTVSGRAATSGTADNTSQQPIQPKTTLANTADVEDLITRFKTDAAVVKSGLDNINTAEDKAGKTQATKAWDIQVDALKKDLTDLKKLNSSNKSDTALHDELEASLESVRKQGVVVTDKFKFDEDTTKKGYKPKSPDTTQITK